MLSLRDKSNIIYLDHNATTALHPLIKQRINDLDVYPYNASSNHSFGRKARMIIEQARQNIAARLNIDLADYKIIFTSSGTEANNLAILGVKRYVLVSAIEHPSIINVVDTMTGKEFIRVNDQGEVDLNHLELLLQRSNMPVLISVMYVNNETGIIQDITQVRELAHKYNAIIHTDAVQAYGKLEIDVKSLNIDMMTISSHKCGGPLGAAALIVKRDIKLEPVIYGGGQEQGLRAGTENIPAILGFGMSADFLTENISAMQQIKILRDYMELELTKYCDYIIFASNKANRVANTSCIMTRGISNETQLIHFDLKNIAVSSGSACSSGKIASSHVLLSMGFDQVAARSAIRVSLGCNNSKDDIDKFITAWQIIYNNTLPYINNKVN